MAVDWLRWYDEEDAGEREEDKAKTKDHCCTEHEEDALECRQRMRRDIRNSSETKSEERHGFIQHQWEGWPALASCLLIPEQYQVRGGSTILENDEVGGMEQQQRKRVTTEEREKWHREYEDTFWGTGPVDPHTTDMADPGAEPGAEPGTKSREDHGTEPGADPGADGPKEAYSVETNDIEEDQRAAPPAAVPPASAPPALAHSRHQRPWRQRPRRQLLRR